MFEVDRAAADIAMDRYAAGDERAFSDVYDALAAPLYRHLRRHVRDAADADDLLQQAFLQLHRARGSFICGARVLPWAFRIAHCLLIDGVRRRGREARYWSREIAEGATDVTGLALPDDLVHGDQMATIIDRIMDGLPESQRVAFELVRLDGMSLADAAEFLQTTTTAVKLRVFRAAETLRAGLNDAGTRSLASQAQNRSRRA